MGKRIFAILTYIFCIVFFSLFGSGHIEHGAKKKIRYSARCATISIRCNITHSSALPHVEKARYIKVRYMKGDVPCDLPTFIKNEISPLFGRALGLTGYIVVSYTTRLLLTAALRGPPSTNSLINF